MMHPPYYRRRRGAVLSILAASVIAVVAATAAKPAIAQAFPNKPIKMVIPFPAGSGSDLIYRPIAAHMSATLGQQVLVDPRPGGGTMIASLFVKSQPPDGYTTYVLSNSAVVKSLVDNAQIDIRKDFTTIGAITISPMMITVNAEKIKARNLKEFLDEAKANPGKLNYASFGMGSGAHVFMEMLSSAAKVQMTHVPYQGTAQSVAATAAGDVHITGSLLVSAKPFLPSGGSGKLRVIGASTGERTNIYPDAPGMKDSGFPEIDYAFWGGLGGPAGMPRPIVDKLNQTLNVALRDPKIMEDLLRGGNFPNPGTPEKFANSINREYGEYVKLMKETGFKFE